MHDQSQWLGLIDYEPAWNLQKNTIPRLYTESATVTLGCEHPAVITHGRRVAREQHAQAILPEVFINRGGLSTLHNPGQLVIYPLCNLKKNQISVRAWVSLLLDVTKNALQKCNIIIVNTKDGLYSINGKIASIGINVNKGVSSHGIAINISNDLSLFSLISPCGVQNQPMDRVCNYDHSMTTRKFFDLWSQIFTERLREK